MLGFPAEKETNAGPIMKAFVKSNHEKLAALLLPLGALGAIAAMAPSPNIQLIEQAEEMIRQPIKQDSVGGIVCEMSLPDNPPPPVDLNGERPLFGPSEKSTYGPDNLCWASESNDGRLLINGIKPLYTRIRLHRIHSGSSHPRYQFEIETLDSSAKAPRKTYATAGLNRPDKRRGISVKEVIGAPNSPDRVVLEVEGILGNIAVTRETAFEHVTGYEADLRYPAANAEFKGVGQGDELRIDRESYQILTINPERVILKATRNGKRYFLQSPDSVVDSR